LWLTIASLGSRCYRLARAGIVTLESVQTDWVALSSNALVVEVVESTRETLVEFSGATNGQGAVGADGETTSVDGTRLGWWTVELELTVVNDRTNSSLAVDEDTILDGEDESIAGWITGDTLLKGSLCWSRWLNDSDLV